MDHSPLILSINGGSSSIKFALFSTLPSLRRVLSGQLERIGVPGTSLTVTLDGERYPVKTTVVANTFEDAVQPIINYLHDRIATSTLSAIGHRVVNGGPKLIDHQLVTVDVVDELRRIQPLDLDHLPGEIALIDAFGDAYPGITQVACFDTAFHKDLPRVAQLLPIPHRYFSAGVKKFGFHGLSYTYLLSELAASAGPEVANGRVIFAHLGSGASMAAVHHRKPIDTTMAFTPASGLMMGTRPGDLDPGLVLYLMKDQKLSPEEMEKFIAKRCGPIGISETSSDMRDLLVARDTDTRAADAVHLFCYSAKKHLGALVSTLGGLDTLVFSGGIGEHAPEVRAALCQGWPFLGLQLDESRNSRGDDTISTDDSRVLIRVIPTDEEIVIARCVQGITEAA